MGTRAFQSTVARHRQGDAWRLSASRSEATGETFVTLLRGSNSLPKARRLRRRHPKAWHQSGGQM